MKKQIAKKVKSKPAPPKIPPARLAKLRTHGKQVERRMEADEALGERLVARIEREDAEARARGETPELEVPPRQPPPTGYLNAVEAFRLRR